MSTKPIIVVFTATGKTGGGMIDAILEDGTFTARAVTRNPESEAAKAIAAKGVEVVKADLDEPATLEAAIKGAYGVFGVTDFWTSFHGEVQQGKNIVDAAKKAEVKHFVWVTLDHSGVPHWDTKAEVDDYLKDSGIPRTSLYTSWFAENIGSPFFPIKRQPSGELLLDLTYKTDGQLGAIYAGDIGKWGLVAFKDPKTWVGKDMKVITEWITPREIAQIVEEELGEKTVIKEVDDEKWKAMRHEVPNFEELWLNFEWLNKNYPDGKGRDIDFSKSLIPHATTVREYIRSKGKSLVTS
ncbi:NAD(P)-binding protein [Serendipita vermifera]|nr:NAD(P)-binding protein [Serendipita vermifera]